MKKKIVLWGTNEKDEKILVALELQEKSNTVDIYTFEQAVCTEDFYNVMLNEWRNGKEVTFPKHQKIERPLTVSDSVLPDTIKVERTDIITRAQAEWHFVVLSSKLYQMYKSEIDDLSDAIEKLVKYDNSLWNDLKSFWTKVSEQVYEKNLFREHATALKEKTNQLFDQLKTMKKAMDKELDEISSKHKETVLTQLSDIESRVEKGMGLKPIFEELKQLQSKIKNMDFNRKHRRQIWDKIDAAFKVVKEKRFGDKGPGGGSSAVERLERRYNGLIGAISKMERSIKRDRDDQEWQSKRANNTDGQLEMQIRQAKIKMIDERIKSKDEKLEDMLKTKVELEGRIRAEKAKAEKRKLEEEENKAKSEAAKAVKAKIANEIKAREEQMAGEAEKLQKAANQISISKKAKKIAPVELSSEDHKKDEFENQVRETIEKVEEKIEDVVDSANNILSTIASTIGDTIEDVVDTVKAVADVVEDKIEAAVDDVKKSTDENE